MSETQVVTGLRAKHDELAAGIADAEQRITKLRGDLAVIDGAIRVFDPDAEIETRRKIIRRAPVLPRGAGSRSVLDTLREAPGPLTAAEIAERLAERYQIAPEAMDALVKAVRAGITRLPRATVLCEWHGREWRYRIADSL